APEKEPLENWHLSSVAPLVHSRDFAVDEQSEILWQMKILGALQFQAINLSIASKKTAGNHRRKGDTLSTVREQSVVARINNNGAKDLTLDKRPFLGLDKVGSGAGTIK